MRFILVFLLVGRSWANCIEFMMEMRKEIAYVGKIAAEDPLAPKRALAKEQWDTWMKKFKEIKCSRLKAHEDNFKQVRAFFRQEMENEEKMCQLDLIKLRRLKEITEGIEALSKTVSSKKQRSLLISFKDQLLKERQGISKALTSEKAHLSSFVDTHLLSASLHSDYFRLLDVLDHEASEKLMKLHPFVWKHDCPKTGECPECNIELKPIWIME